MDFDQLHKKVKAIDLDVLKSQAFDTVKPKIIKLNQQQLLFGLNGRGQSITPSYSSIFTARAKHKQNSKPGLWTPDLFKSGDMFSEMEVVQGIPNDKSYVLISNVPYFNKLNRTYKYAFDLQPENIAKIDATDKLIELYNKALGI